MEPVTVASCCFTGRRDIPAARCDAVFAAALHAVYTLYEKGCRRFYAGGALGFDTLAALAVLKAKETHPDLCLVIARPCENQDRFWRPEDRQRYREILSLADEAICLSPGYYNGCMQARNRYMVDHADICVAYGGRTDGGTHYTIQYARKVGIPVIQLETPEDEE